MAGSLESVTRKLDRADYHIKDIDSRISTFSAHPYDVIPYENGDTEETELRLANVKGMPTEWPAIIGDAINNLRSALDHLMWNLVLLNGNSPGRNTQFPIVTSGNGYDGESCRMTGGASSKHIAEIKGLQPYHRTGAEKTHPLFWLNQLSNFDKHRVLLLSEIAVTSGGLGIGAMRGFDLHLSYVRTPEAKEGAILASFKLIPSGPNSHVQMHPQVPCEIRFAQGCPDCIIGKPVMDVMNAIRSCVNDDVIGKFRGDF
jgi:hypothetical protein